MPESVNVICMKWGTKYGPEYVNRLYHGVQRLLSLPHRFVCFTDDAAGIDPGVEIQPIPELGVPKQPGRDHAWRKLLTLEKDLGGLKGRTLFLDVDLVLVGSLDVFFEPPAPFHIIHDWKRPGSIEGNSSVYRFEIGAHADVLAEFRANYKEIQATHRNEQAYLSAAMEARGLLAYWPADWCVSYKRRCIPAFPANLWRMPTCPPQTRVVVFHGDPKPEDAMIGAGNKWYRPARAAPWIGEAWLAGETA